MSQPANGHSAQELSEIERNAYNAAFHELDLAWYWDAETYASLRAAANGKCHVRIFLEAHSPHLLRAYDADFLVNAIETQRAKVRRAVLN